MKVEKTPFTCPRGPFTLRGFVYKAGNHNGTPVIMSHAFLSNQKIMQKYAAALAEAGYVVFTYDFCGGAILGKSSGKFSDMSLDTEKADLLAVIGYAAGQGGLRMENLVLLGASQGGFVSCLAAAELGQKVHKLVLLYPALCIPDDARKGRMMTIRFDPQDLEGTFTSRPFRFSTAYPRSAMGLDAMAVVRRITAPILIIHGDADQIVSLRYAEEAARAASHPGSRLVVLQGAKHGFNKQQVAQALQAILPYLAESAAPQA